MGSSPWTALLAGVEVVAGLSKGFFGYSEDRHRRNQIRVVVWILLTIESGANIAVGVFSIRRFWKCGGLTRTSFTFVGDLVLFVYEAFYTFEYLNTKQAPVSEFKSGLISIETICLSLKEMIAPVLMGMPFGIAAIRSYLKQPLKECSSSSQVDSIVILCSSVLLCGLISCLVVGYYARVFDIFDLEGALAFFSGLFLFTIFVLPVSLGIWAAAQPERQVLVHGLLLIVPPILTWMVVFVKNIRPEYNPSEPKDEEDPMRSNTNVP